MKRVIALGMLVVGGTLVAAPAAGAAPTCPPGTKDDPYCVPAVKVPLESVNVTRGGVVKIPITCVTRPRCFGRILLVTRGARGSQASAVANASAKVGSSRYSIPYNRTERVQTRLSRRGRKLLGRTGRLRVAVVSISQGERQVLDTITLRGRKIRHVTGVKKDPGFTG